MIIHEERCENCVWWHGDIPIGDLLGLCRRESFELREICRGADIYLAEALITHKRVRCGSWTRKETADE